jgi:hypothetical protein
MNIETAIVLVRRHPSGVGPATPIAGVPVLARILLALADADIHQAIVFGDLEPHESDEVLTVGVTDRLQVQLARVREGETETMALSRLVGGGGRSILLVPSDVWLDARTLRSLLLQSSGQPAVALSEDGLTGLAVLNAQSVAALASGLSLVDDVASLAERGEVLVARPTGPCRRVWELRDQERAEDALYADAVARPGEPLWWRSMMEPFRRVFVLAAVRAGLAPPLLAGLAAFAGLGAASLIVGGTPGHAPFAAALLALSSWLAGMQAPVERALRYRAAPSRLHPYAQHTWVMAVALAAATFAHQRAGGVPWAVLVGGGGVAVALALALVLQLRRGFIDADTFEDAMAWSRAPGALRSVRALRWLLRPPYAGLTLAALLYAAPAHLALLAFAILAGVALMAAVGGLWAQPSVSVQAPLDPALVTLAVEGEAAPSQAVDPGEPEASLESAAEDALELGEPEVLPEWVEAEGPLDAAPLEDEPLEFELEEAMPVEAEPPLAQEVAPTATPRVRAARRAALEAPGETDLDE